MRQLKKYVLLGLNDSLWSVYGDGDSPEELLTQEVRRSVSGLSRTAVAKVIMSGVAALEEDKEC